MASQKVQYLRCAASLSSEKGTGLSLSPGEYAAFLGICDALILNFFLCHPKIDFLRVHQKKMMKDPDKYLPHVISALIVAILPHLSRLPVWIVVWCLLMWGYELLLLRFQWRRPGRKSLVFLAAAGILGLLAT